MFISRKAYDDLRDQALTASAVCTKVEQHNVALQTTMDWMRTRLNQLEHERAQLIYQYMGVKIAVPVIAPTPAVQPETVADMVNDMPSFNDVGDEEAAKQGIGWNLAGEVVYKAVQKG